MTNAKKLIDEYLLAIQNEIAIDERFSKIFNIQFNKTGRIPRLPAWLAYTKHPLFLLKIAYILVFFIWIFGGFIIFNTYKFLTLLIRNQRTNLKPYPNSVALLFSSRAEDVIDQALHKENIELWITTNKVQPRNKNGRNYIDITELYSFKEIFYSFFLSLAGCLALFFDKKSSLWALQGYTSYSWFLNRISLASIKAENFFMAEHYDRWAVLADTLISGKNLSSHLILVQHGTLKGLNSEKPEPLFLPYRLSNITKLYCYNQEDYLFFQNFVLSKEKTDNTVAYYYTPAINLKKINNAKHTLSLLIVGHPSCEDFHREIFKILSNDEINIIYKSHPRSPSSPEVTTAGWIIWHDKESFPQVNVVISYPSTLVEEYRAAGIDVIVHPMNAEASMAQEISSLALRKINRL
ncbi:MAG: hypothetical protein ACN6OM_18295 [Alcaligenes nematophilus]|uniref:hypothetical protein n=1 Tax=Alcaligenes nematophilus TaxID=2994643 RepID=UPI000AD96E0C|nr:hypothetical protein [Alcaligenes faecalis]